MSIQNISIRKRKIILWLVVGVLGASLVFWWVIGFKHKVENFKKEQFIDKLEIPSIEGVKSDFEAPKEAVEEQINLIEDMIKGFSTSTE